MYVDHEIGHGEQNVMMIAFCRHIFNRSSLNIWINIMILVHIVAEIIQNNENLTDNNATMKIQQTETQYIRYYIYTIFPYLVGITNDSSSKHRCTSSEFLHKYNALTGT